MCLKLWEILIKILQRAEFFICWKFALNAQLNIYNIIRHNEKLLELPVKMIGLVNLAFKPAFIG